MSLHGGDGEVVSLVRGLLTPNSSDYIYHGRFAILRRSEEITTAAVIFCHVLHRCQNSEAAEKTCCVITLILHSAVEVASSYKRRVPGSVTVLASPL